MTRRSSPLAVFLLLSLSALAADANSVPQTITSPLGKKMTLKFHDEFNAVKDTDGQPYIDRSKWETTFWQGTKERTLGGNREAQIYTDKNYAGPRGGIKPAQRINPFSFEKPGILTISATTVPESLWADFGMTTERHFASGLLTSDKSFTFKYGYVEGRFKLPPNRGSWPALWLLGNDPSLGDPIKAHAWPPEIDIFEFMGHWGTKFSGAILVKKNQPAEKVNPWTLRYNEVGTDLTKDFHTWAFEWDENELVFLFDGQIWLRGKTPPSLGRPMYLLINLAVGGRWYGEEMTKLLKKPVAPWEVDAASMPWKMECDYIRVYQQL
jgi:beta-glucanase (GH16 family)